MTPSSRLSRWLYVGSVGQLRAFDVPTPSLLLLPTLVQAIKLRAWARVSFRIEDICKTLQPRGASVKMPTPHAEVQSIFPINFIVFL